MDEGYLWGLMGILRNQLPRHCCHLRMRMLPYFDTTSIFLFNRGSTLKCEQINPFLFRINKFKNLVMSL